MLSIVDQIVSFLGWIVLTVWVLAFAIAGAENLINNILKYRDIINQLWVKNY